MAEEKLGWWNQFRSTRGDTYSHTSLIDPKGIFNIDPKKRKEFFEKQCNWVAGGNSIGLAEYPLQRMPVLVDMDPKFPFSILQQLMPDEPIPGEGRPRSGIRIPRVYDEKFIRHVAQVFQECIDKYFDVPATKVTVGGKEETKAFVCCLLEKKFSSVKDPNIKSGFHLHFAFGNPEKRIQNTIMRKYVNDTIRRKKILELLPFKPVNDLEDINDKGILDNTWLCYGSSKEDGKEPYKLTRVFGRITDPNDPKQGVLYSSEEKSTSKNLLEIFDPKELTFVKRGDLGLEFFKDHSPEWFLPIFLSIQAWDFPLVLKPEVALLVPAEEEKAIKTKKRPGRKKVEKKRADDSSDSGSEDSEEDEGKRKGGDEDSDSESTTSTPRTPISPRERKTSTPNGTPKLTGLDGWEHVPPVKTPEYDSRDTASHIRSILSNAHRSDEERSESSHSEASQARKEKGEEKKRKGDQEERKDRKEVIGALKINKRKNWTAEDLKNEKLIEAENLIPMLSVERARDRNSWIRVGWLLYNISGGSPGGLEIWVKFSKKSDTVKDRTRCREEWDRMRQSNMTLGTLVYWVKQDSPERYEKYRENSIEGLVRANLKSPFHFDAAMLIDKLYHHQYRCASIKHKIWYEFKEHRWVLVESASSLRIKISTDVVKLFKGLRTKISKENEDVEDADQDKKADERMSQVAKCLKNFKTTSFKKGIMEELADLMVDDKFLEKLDETDGLLHFTNGVLDLKQSVADKKPCLRAGHPDDFISKSTKIPFLDFSRDEKEVMELKDDSPEVEALKKHYSHMVELKEYLRKVFPNERVRKYLVRFGASLLKPFGPGSKRIRFFIGEGGDNAKSMTCELFMRTFGERAIKFPSTMLTGRRAGSSSATPELSRIPGMLVGFIQEPEASGSVNLSLYKEISGLEEIYVRDLFQPGRHVKPKLKLVVSANNAPEIPPGEKAAWNRTEVVPYESTFVPAEELPGDEKAQWEEKKFLRDETLPEKIPDWAPAFMWLVVQDYIHGYSVEGITAPPEVKLATQDYRASHDVYEKYKMERLEEEKGKKFDIGESYPDFQEWHRQSYPQKRPPDKDVFKKQMCKTFGKKQGTTIITGWRQKEDKEHVHSPKVGVDPSSLLH